MPSERVTSIASGDVSSNCLNRAVLVSPTGIPAPPRLAAPVITARSIYEAAIYFTTKREIALERYGDGTRANYATRMSRTCHLAPIFWQHAAR